MLITVNASDHKGGLILVQRRGRAHFGEIVKKAQITMRLYYPIIAGVWRRRGRRLSKFCLDDIIGKKPENKAKGGCDPT